MQSENHGKGKSPDLQAAESLVARLQRRIIALEKELALYGSKYGFSDTARALLASPKEH